MLIPAILFLAPILSGSFVFLFKRSSENNIKLLLAFSGSYLFSISVLHLIPEIYTSSSGINIGVFVLLGFFIQVLLEFFSGGIEHGHIHIHESNNDLDHHNNNDHGHGHLTMSLPMLISLCIHAFVEGMPLANEALLSGNTRTLLLGIVLHKIPIAFVLMSLLLFHKTKTPMAIGILVLFALAAPAGYAVSFGTEAIHSHPHEVTAVVVGILLHVSTTILFESSSNHRFNLYKIIIIIFGASLAFLNI